MSTTVNIMAAWAVDLEFVHIIVAPAGAPFGRLGASLGESNHVKACHVNKLGWISLVIIMLAFAL